MNDQIPSSTAESRPAGEVRVRRGRRELVATVDAISIGDQVFRLADVDRVSYHAAARINQASYLIGLGRSDAKHKFTFDAYRRGTELEDSRETWGRLVSLLEATACPRLADGAARAIWAGETVTFGAPPANRIDADAEGLRPHRPFARTVPWARVVGADLREGQVRVWTATNGARDDKPKMTVGMSGWNAVLLPRVVAILGSPSG